MKRVLFSSQKTGISIDPIHPLLCLWKGRQAGELDRSSSPSKKQRTKLGKGRFLLQLPAPSRPATMHKLGRGNKVKLQQFMSVTGVSEKAALAILHGRDWNMDGAFEFFYNQPPSRSKTDPRRLEDLYMRYKDPFSDMISVDGITLFCEDLKVDPGDIVTLVISWHMKAATMCEFSRQEFIGGLLSLGVDSIDKLKSLLPTLRTELKDEHKFKEIYNFAFTWAKEKGQKSLALDTALGMWRLMFAERPWPLVEHWCNFLQTKHNKAISKDTWSQLFEFSRIDPSLSNYDAEGAWPYLIDEFVEYLNEKGLRVL